MEEVFPKLIDKQVGGWPDRVISASDEAFHAPHSCVPKAMTLEDIESFKKSFLEGVKRALKVGFDVSLLFFSFIFIRGFTDGLFVKVIEIHAAHGYLLHSTLSAATNKLPAPYSGSLENRIRLLLELTKLVREAIPDSMPLFVRIPGSDVCNPLLPTS